MSALRQLAAKATGDRWDKESVDALADLHELAPEMALLLADAMAWIDESMHSADDDLDGGHALLARFAVLERRAAHPAGGAT